MNTQQFTTKSSELSVLEQFCFDDEHIDDLHNYIYNSHFSTEWLMKFADLLDFAHYYNSNAEEFFNDAFFLGANVRYELITHTLLYIRDCNNENELSNILEYMIDNEELNSSTLQSSENIQNLALPPVDDNETNEEIINGIDLCIAESYDNDAILYKHIILMNLTDGEYINYLI